MTFLFTDIEGSTTRWDRFPAAMQAAVRRHDELGRAILGAHRGYVFKTLGDAFCCAFARARDAAHAALALRTALDECDFSAVDGLRVRMALHSGSAHERDGDYFGPALNRTARLLGVAHGGQILASQTTYGLLAGEARDEVELYDLGMHVLRDLTRSEHVYEIAVPGSPPSAFPPLRSLGALPNNLPTMRTSFINHEREIAVLVRLVTDHRLVTLTGAGGIGKTRTSLLVGAELLDTFADGVWLVELAALTDPANVAATVASAINVKAGSGTAGLATLVNALRPQRMLLILDNCEHVVAAVADLVAAILSGAPHLHVLASSRQNLKVAGEMSYRMPSLAVPTEHEALRIDARHALEHPAIALFVERTSAADQRFALDDTNAPIVADIVRRLDGIPLAIELAAPRARMLNVRQLRDRIDERFRLLTGGSRDVLPRQQTLRAVIDWSYDLLDDSERVLFERIGVFADGFTLDAAVAVCSDDMLDEFALLDLLASLVDKSLVNAEPSSSEHRYRMLESTRAYALDRLRARGDTDARSAAHARWIAAAVDRWYGAYWLTPIDRWMRMVMPERDNIRAALRWALGPGDDLGMAARIAGGLEGLWSDGGLIGEGRRWIETILERLPPDARGDDLARLWLTYAGLRTAKGMAEAAQRAIDGFGGQPSIVVAEAYRMLAIGQRRMGLLTEALAAIDRALDLFMRAGATASWPYVRALDSRAGILRFMGRTAEARSVRAEALARSSTLDDPSTTAIVRSNLADLEALIDPAAALVLSLEAADAFRELGELLGEARATINAAAIGLLLDDVAVADEHARTGLRLALRAGWEQGITIALQHIGSVAVLRGDVQVGVALLGYADAWYARESFAREPTEARCYERTWAAVRATLDETELAALLRAGAGLPFEKIEALAR